MEFIRFLRFVYNLIRNFSFSNCFFLLSTEIHKLCFIIFIATSECYMLISYILNRHSRKMLDAVSSTERKSLRFKRALLFINIVGFWFAGYFFIRHNAYCEPGGKHSISLASSTLSICFNHFMLSLFSVSVYTFFALAEYVVVLTNMAFHMTAFWDFSDKIIVCDRINGFDMVTSNQYARLK